MSVLIPLSKVLPFSFWVSLGEKKTYSQTYIPVALLRRPAFSRNEARAGPKDFVMSSIPIDHGVRVFICTYAKRPVLKVKIKLRKNGRCQR
jgi:hypothetical protein